MDRLGIYLFFGWLNSNKRIIAEVFAIRKTGKLLRQFAKEKKFITTTARFQKPERSQGPVVCVYGGHLQRCEKIQSVFENSFLQSARPTLREIRPQISQRSPLRLLISEQISHKL